MKELKKAEILPDLSLKELKGGVHNSSNKEDKCCDMNFACNEKGKEKEFEKQ